MEPFRLSRAQILSVYSSGPDAVVRLVEDLVAIINEQAQQISKQGELIKRQEGKIVRLETRVQELEERMSKNSRNSSKPPSTDGPNPLARTKSLRERSGRKPGGQTGHEGSALQIVENPDEVVKHPVHSCHHCGRGLRGVAVSSIDRRQEFELPSLQLRVTEHQAEVKHCPCCGGETRGEMPDGLEQVAQYGPGFKSLAVYFMNAQYVPYQRVCDIFKELFGHSFSAGSLYNFNRELFGQLAGSEDRIRGEIRRSATSNHDETGADINGGLNWVHSASTQTATLYMIHARRGTIAQEAMGILAGYQGRAIHDHFPSYFEFACKHGLCNAHHLRELRFLAEVKKEPWAAKMKKCLQDMKKNTDLYRQKRGKVPTRLSRYFTSRYDRIMREGFAFHRGEPAIRQKKRGRPKQSPGKNMLDRLLGHKEEVLAFLHDLTVPFDNNQAERDIRMVKVKQKISGCYRSMDGARLFCRIRGFISTLRKRDLPVLQSIADAFLGFAPI